MKAAERENRTSQTKFKRYRDERSDGFSERVGQKRNRSDDTTSSSIDEELRRRISNGDAALLRIMIRGKRIERSEKRQRRRRKRRRGGVDKFSLLLYLSNLSYCRVFISNNNHRSRVCPPHRNIEYANGSRIDLSFSENQRRKESTMKVTTTSCSILFLLVIIQIQHILAQEYAKMVTFSIEVDGVPKHMDVKFEDDGRSGANVLPVDRQCRGFLSQDTRISYLFSICGRKCKTSATRHICTVCQNHALFGSREPRRENATLPNT